MARDYTLPSDIGCPQLATGLTVTSGVTVDGAGHKLTGAGDLLRGNDNITIASSITNSAVVLGGAGDDIISATGSGNNVLIGDGAEALSYLRREGEHAKSKQPDLILLDLNLPKKDGREVLAEIKSDERLKEIPVVVLTTSAAPEDVRRAYGSHANCYITKPVDLDQFLRVVQSIESFWLSLVTLPTH